MQHKAPPGGVRADQRWGAAPAEGKGNAAAAAPSVNLAVSSVGPVTVLCWSLDGVAMARSFGISLPLEALQLRSEIVCSYLADLWEACTDRRNVPLLEAVEHDDYTVYTVLQIEMQAASEVLYAHQYGMASLRGFSGAAIEGFVHGRICTEEEFPQELQRFLPPVYHMACKAPEVSVGVSIEMEALSRQDDEVAEIMQRIGGLEYASKENQLDAECTLPNK